MNIIKETEGQRDRRERCNAIKKVFGNSEKGIRTLGEVVELLRGEGIYTNQTTVHRDLKELNIKRDDVFYCVTEPEEIKLQKNALSLMLNNYAKRISKVRKTTYSIAIKVNKGHEYSIAEIIMNIFGKKITGVIPGMGLVLILSNNKTNINIVHDWIKENCKEELRVNFKNSDIDEEDEEG